jgi:hypothetical protein
MLIEPEYELEGNVISAKKHYKQVDHWLNHN